MRFLGIALVILVVAAGAFAAQPANIGWMYMHGIVLPRDEVAARKWYLRAAREGDLDGAYELALMLHAGDGGPKDQAGRDRWMRYAADHGHVNAEMILGQENLPNYGGKDRKPDFEEAYFWIKLSLRNDPHHADPSDLAAQHLTKEQIAKLDRRVAEWKPATGAPPVEEPQKPAVEQKPAKEK